MYVQSAFERDSGLQHCKAKANDYTLLPLLQNTAGKYLSHPLVRYVDQLFGVCTLTGVVWHTANQNIYIIHKQLQDINPVYLHTGTYSTMLEGWGKTVFNKWRTTSISRVSRGSSSEWLRVSCVDLELMFKQGSLG